jgi:type II secretory pathway pseudopilin PulG
MKPLSNPHALPPPATATNCSDCSARDRAPQNAEVQRAQRNAEEDGPTSSLSASLCVLHASALSQTTARGSKLLGARRAPLACPAGRRCAGFTFKELLIVIAVVVVLAGFLLPALPAPKTKAQRIHCINNLRQVGTAFRLWAGDFGGTNGLYPTHVSTNSGGAMELLVRGEMWPMLQLMSNELQVTKLLTCPADIRQVAPDFASLRNTNLSYFVSRDAGASQPNRLLTGDRNLEVAGRPVPAGRFTLGTNQLAGWSESLHKRCGNVGLGDGSAMQLNNARFQEFLRQGQPATNGLVIP